MMEPKGEERKNLAQGRAAGGIQGQEGIVKVRNGPEVAVEVGWSNTLRG